LSVGRGTICLKAVEGTEKKQEPGRDQAQQGEKKLSFSSSGGGVKPKKKATGKKRREGKSQEEEGRVSLPQGGGIFLKEWIREGRILFQYIWKGTDS